MSSINFYEAVKIACIEKKTSIKLLVEEMHKAGIPGVYNYVYQVLKRQRNNDKIIEWFCKRLEITDKS